MTTRSPVNAGIRLAGGGCQRPVVVAAERVRERAEQVAAVSAVAVDALLRRPDRPTARTVVPSGALADDQLFPGAKSGQGGGFELVRRAGGGVLEIVHPRQEFRHVDPGFGRQHQADEVDPFDTPLLDAIGRSGSGRGVESRPPARPPAGGRTTPAGRNRWMPLT